MKTQLEEAAEDYFMKYTDIISMAGTKEKVVKAVVGFHLKQSEQSNQAIHELEKQNDELRKALEIITSQFEKVEPLYSNDKEAINIAREALSNNPKL